MSLPCPPFGGMITLNIGFVEPVGTLPEARSKVPKVYPSPPEEIVTDSILDEPLIATVASAP